MTFVDSGKSHGAGVVDQEISRQRKNQSTRFQLLGEVDRVRPGDGVLLQLSQRCQMSQVSVAKPGSIQTQTVNRGELTEPLPFRISLGFEIRAQNSQTRNRCQMLQTGCGDLRTVDMQKFKCG